jgi:glutathione peroxidase
MSSVHGYLIASADGLRTVPLSAYSGKVIVVVNAASMCGFTAANMESLTSIQNEFGTAKVQVLLFPCGQFANQEPKTACEFRDWASAAYRGTESLPWLEKVKVKGPDAHPLFVALQKSLGPIRWNFTKFVCDVNGVPVRKFDAAQCGTELRDAVQSLLA